MTTFHIFSALLILGVVLVFLRTIFKSRSVLSSTQSETNLRLLRDQLKELKEDHRVGNLSTEQYEASKTEIEGRVVEEVSREPQSMVLSGRLAKIVSIAVVVLIPISALYLYSFIGSHDGQDIESYLEAQNKPVDHLEFEALEAKVIKHIEENPGDTQAWGMLAKTYQAMQKFDEAANAWARQLHPDSLKIDSPVKHTVSMAIPGSILRGAQTRELRSYLVGQIARAAAVHEIDEIIVLSTLHMKQQRLI